MPPKGWLKARPHTISTGVDGVTREFKQCIDCGNSLELSSFYAARPRNPTADGLRARCKVCNGRQETKWKLVHINRLRERALALLGNKCAWCGFTDVRTFHIDHVYGYGWLDRLMLNHQQRLMRVLEIPSDYQILCANCNTIKAKETDEFNHKKYTGIKDDWAQVEDTSVWSEWDG